MKERDLALKLANKTKSTHDRGRFTMLRNKVVRSLRKAKADFFITIIEKSNGNPKVIWSQIRKMTGDQPNEQKTVEIKVNDQLINNTLEVAEAFNHHFIDSVANIASCFTPENVLTPPIDTSQSVFNIFLISQNKKYHRPLNRSDHQDAKIFLIWIR